MLTASCQPILVSSDAQSRVGAARAWIEQAREDDGQAPLVLLVSDLAAAGDVVRPLLVAPPAARRSGRRSGHRHGPKGPRALFNVARLTLDLLAAELCRTRLASRELNVASPLCQQAVVGRLLAEQQDGLRHFDRVLDGLGFARALARTLGELRLHQATVASLAALGAPAGEDLARLLEAYDEVLAAERLIDRAGLLEHAAAAVEAGEAPASLVHARYFLLDVPIEAPLEVALLGALVAGGAELRAALPKGDDRGEAGLSILLGVAAATAQEREDDDEPPLRRLQRRLFAPSEGLEVDPGDGDGAEGGLALDDQVEIFSAPSADLECVEIARRIGELAAEGLPADAVAVLLRQPVPYAELLEQALARAGLGCYLSGAASRPDPAGRAFLLLLRCALEELSAARFAEYLSLGQVPSEAPPQPVDAPSLSDWATAEADDDPTAPAASGWISPTRWERLLGNAAVVGGLDRWRTRLDGLAAELAARAAHLDDPEGGAARAVARDIDQLDRLRTFALPLLERLAALPEQARWGEWIEHLGALASAGLRRPARVREVLAELWPLADSATVDLHRVLNVLDHRLAALPRRARGHRYGQVFVGPIDDARGRAFEVVFVPGLAERIFPGKVLQDPVLLDRLRARLPAAGLPLRTRGDRRARERLALRLAVGAATRRLVLSYPRLDLATGQPRVPSFYFLEAARALAGALPHFEELVRRAAEATSTRLHRPSPRDPARAIDDQEYDLARLAEARRRRGEPNLGGYLAHLHQHPHLIGALRAHWRRGGPTLTEQDGLVVSGGDALELIASESLARRPHAVTSVERFAACPYRFYLQSVLRLRPATTLGPPPEGELDPRTRGQLFHRVQFELFQELDRQHALPVDPANLAAAQRTLDETLERVAEELRETLAPAVRSLWREEVAALALELRAWLQREAADAEHQPLHWEYAFGLPLGDHSDARSTEQPACVDRFLLRGAIDLVERRRGDGKLRITDYKTGAPPRGGPGGLGGGTRLQRVLYALAYEALNPASEAAHGRLYYCTARGEYREATIALDGRLREQALGLLAFIDEAIRAGRLPAAPDPDCSGCDYAVVCGREAADRWRAKSRRCRRDPWIVDLARLRRS